METAGRKITYLKDYSVPTYRIENVQMRFQLKDNDCVVTALSTFSKNPESADASPDLFLDGIDLELLSVKMDGTPLQPPEYQLTESGMTVVAPSAKFTLEIVTRIYPDKNSALEGLYRSSGNFCTQCEAQGFRKITFYLDRPDVLAVFTTRIEADEKSCPVLLANGNLIEEGSLADGRHYAVWNDPFPKPCYLFALVAGDLVALKDTFVTRSGRTINLHIFVQERNQQKCDHAMSSLKKSMRWDEEVFGLEYDLETYMIVAVDDFNMGAMENKGLNVFNSKYVLASPETATDQDYLGIEGVIAHEYFHNWTGNRVTCRDWFQLSLKEGLTVFRDQEFSSDMNSRPVQRVDDVRILRSHQFREDSGPMAHPVRPESYMEINNFYTVTIYNKGAEVIRMMHTLLGKEGFRKGMDLYFERHDGQAVTCDDFVAAMEDASGVDLTQFKLWYSQAGTPQLQVTEEWSEETGVYSIIVRQSCPATKGQKDKKPFHIPIAIGLLDGDGNDIEHGNTILPLTLAEERFEFSGLSGKPVLSFLRGFSAPVKVGSWQSREQLSFLIEHDTDDFNRWDAAYSFSEQVILENISLLQQQKEMRLDPVYLASVKHLLNDRDGDKSLIAMALSLPEEMYLAQQMDVVDPDNIHKAVKFVREQISLLLQEDLQAVYVENINDAPYSLSPQDMAQRKLKNTCLSYLLAANKPDSVEVERAVTQYKSSDNMTDMLAALAVISRCDIPEREELLQDFYETWKDDTLIIDKWLILQASAGLPTTLERVKSLMQHPAFSMANPNKVRSLIGAFGANHVCFHAENGEGYRFLADQILSLDSTNPQIASRLTSPFSTWKRYDSKRQELMKMQLERIAAKDGLSGGVYEMVQRTLSP